MRQHGLRVRLPATDLIHDTRPGYDAGGTAANATDARWQTHAICFPSAG